MSVSLMNLFNTSFLEIDRSVTYQLLSNFLIVFIILVDIEHIVFIGYQHPSWSGTHGLRNTWYT